MTCANVLVGRVKDYEGRGPGRCWTGDGGAAICVATAKGATEATCETEGKLLISIHAPAKGATTRASSRISSTPFQSTLPRRERRKLKQAVKNGITISIHAPAKGATRTPRCHWRARLLFQSTLPRRERQAEQRKADKTKAFQSTLPRRERHDIGLGRLIS